MVNYLSLFIPNKAEMTEPLRQLVKDGVHVTWGRAQKEATKRIKAVLSSQVILRYYDENKPLTIQADASQNGFGACPLQEGQPISYASRTMTDTEIIFAKQRFHHYIYGIDVTVHSYHKQLESIQHKELSKVSPRLQNMLMRILCYRINIVYKPGKQMHIADALSRAHL